MYGLVIHFKPEDRVYDEQILDTVLYEGDDVEKLMYLYTCYNYFYKDKENYTLEATKHENLNVPDVDMLLICVQKAYMDNGRIMRFEQYDLIHEDGYLKNDEAINRALDRVIKNNFQNYCVLDKDGNVVDIPVDITIPKNYKDILPEEKVFKVYKVEDLRNVNKEDLNNNPDILVAWKHVYVKPSNINVVKLNCFNMLQTIIESYVERK